MLDAVQSFFGARRSGVEKDVPLLSRSEREESIDDDEEEVRGSASKGGSKLLRKRWLIITITLTLLGLLYIHSLFKQRNVLLDYGSIKLNTGASMPMLGLGTWMGAPYRDYDDQGRTIEEIATQAIDLGYRHFDTASIYGTEAGVGRAISKANVAREQLFFTTKMADKDHNNATRAFEASLTESRLDYIDLWLMHWPMGYHEQTRTKYGFEDVGDRRERPTFEQTWQDMEEVYLKEKDKGSASRLKAIGVANFSKQNLERLLKIAIVKPAVNQIEGHPYLPSKELGRLCQEHNIHVVDYSPLGGSVTRPNVLLASPKKQLLAVSAKHNATVTQIALSWGRHLKADAGGPRTSIPKASSIKHLQENLQIVNLDAEDMRLLDTIAEEERGGTRLNAWMCDGQTGQLFGWTMEQLGFPEGFHTSTLPPSAPAWHIPKSCLTIN